MLLWEKRDNLKKNCSHFLESKEDPIPVWIHQILKPPKIELTEGDKADEITEPKSANQDSERENTNSIGKKVENLL